MKQTRAALYVRVSSGEQHTETQKRALREYVQRRDGHCTRSIVTSAREQAQPGQAWTSCLRIAGTGLLMWSLSGNLTDSLVL